MYAVSIARSAQKEIHDLDRPIIPRVMAAIHALTDDARPPGCKKLVGSRDLWRIRVGDYRIIYRIDDRTEAIEVVIVRHRSAVYD